MKLLKKILKIFIYASLGIIGLFYLSVSIYKETHVDTTKEIIELTYSNGDKDTITAPPSFITLYKGDLRYNDRIHSLIIASQVRKYEIIKK